MGNDRLCARDGKNKRSVLAYIGTLSIADFQHVRVIPTCRRPRVSPQRCGDVGPRDYRRPAVSDVSTDSPGVRADFRCPGGRVFPTPLT